MRRISTNMPNNDLQYQMKLRDFKMSETQSRIGSSSRLNNLRDDPVAAAHATRYQSYLSRMDRFGKNIGYTQDRYAMMEAYMNETVEIVQRIRERTVQGANGIYSKDDMKLMAVEVNELLNELVQVGNAIGADGKTLFSGDRTESLPFNALEGRVAGIDGRVVTSVNYTGSITENQAEISEGKYVSVTIPGNEIFWAEQQSLYAKRDTSSYAVTEDTSIFIDRTEIALKAGDNIHSIISKINSSDLSVKASLDPVMNSLVLNTTQPHQIWIEDGAGGRVMKDLGVLAETGSRPPSNYHPEADIAGGSLFDVVIQVRDSMLSGDNEALGGRGLKGMDQALNNILVSMADLGARTARLDQTAMRLDKETLDVQDMQSRTVDLDLTEAITELKMLEVTRKAAYQASARVLQPTLMDYLK